MRLEATEEPARLSLRGGPVSRSPDLAAGMLPTRFGGGSNVLTSLVSIVAKYRGWARYLSSSCFPETFISVYPIIGLREPLSFAPLIFERWFDVNSPAFDLKALNFSMTLTALTGPGDHLPLNIGVRNISKVYNPLTTPITTITSLGPIWSPSCHYLLPIIHRCRS